MVNFMPSLVHFILKISTTGKVCKKSWESPGKKRKKRKNENHFYFLCRKQMNLQKQNSSKARMGMLYHRELSIAAEHASFQKCLL